MFVFSTGSRATVTWRFGFVALDLLNVITADAGVYTCRATNVKGQDETSANLRITGGLLPGTLTLYTSTRPFILLPLKILI